MKESNNHSKEFTMVQTEINAINSNIMRTLKNQGHETKLLDREIDRMQRIDRVKVEHARNSFFIPEMGGMAPSLDHFNASRSTHHQSEHVPNMDDFTTQRNVIT